MPKCPFCGMYVIKGEGDMICPCGEVLPEDLHEYARESVLCGNTEFPEELDDPEETSVPENTGIYKWNK